MDGTSADAMLLAGRAHALGASWIDPSQPLVLIAIYCVMIVTASVLGGFLPDLLELNHTRMQTLVSGVGGLMLGIAAFHLLPHSVRETGSIVVSTRWMMAGLLSMFFLIRVFRFHHHGTAEQTHGVEPCAHGAHEHRSLHRLSWIGVAFGLSLHTLIDGLALGSSVYSEARLHPGAATAGLGTFLAILLHKPLDAVSITSLMTAGRWSPRWKYAVNAGFALMCPLGAIGFVLGVEYVGGREQMIVGAALAFSAGVFLCISLGDLLPELELHSHHRLRLSIALLLGVLIAWAVEQTHTHSNPTGSSEVNRSVERSVEGRVNHACRMASRVPSGHGSWLTRVVALVRSRRSVRSGSTSTVVCAFNRVALSHAVSPGGLRRRLAFGSRGSSVPARDEQSECIWTPQGLANFLPGVI